MLGSVPIAEKIGPTITRIAVAKKGTEAITPAIGKKISPIVFTPSINSFPIPLRSFTIEDIPPMPYQICFQISCTHKEANH